MLTGRKRKITKMQQYFTYCSATNYKLKGWYLITWKSNSWINRSENSEKELRYKKKIAATAKDNDQIKQLGILCSIIWIRKWCKEWPSQSYLQQPRNLICRINFWEQSLADYLWFRAQNRKAFEKKIYFLKQRESSKTVLIPNKYYQELTKNSCSMSTGLWIILLT